MSYEKYHDRSYFLAQFSYRGDAFHGVQEQPGLKTVLGALRARLEAGAQQEARALTVAARTDRGVSALENYATFYVQKPVDAEHLMRVAARAQGDGLLSVTLTNGNHKLHARGCARAKTYRYTIKDAMTESDQTMAYAWQIVPPLSIAAMRCAAMDFVGKKDFSSVRGGGCQAGSVVKEVISIAIERTSAGYILIDIKGHGFLRKMIRNMVGLLVEIGAGLRHSDAIPEILHQKHRMAAGIMAPAHGLCLMNIELQCN